MDNDHTIHQGWVILAILFRLYIVVWFELLVCGPCTGREGGLDSTEHGKGHSGILAHFWGFGVHYPVAKAAARASAVGRHVTWLARALRPYSKGRMESSLLIQTRLLEFCELFLVRYVLLLILDSKFG